MILRLNTVAAEFRKVSNKQMADTTKRAIRENVMINSQLSKMSGKTIDLISENDEAKTKNKSLKQELHVLEDNQKELLRKNAANHKVIVICKIVDIGSWRIWQFNYFLFFSLTTVSMIV